MNEIIDSFIQDPTKGIALGAVFLASYFIVADRKRRESDFKSFEGKLSVWEKSTHDNMSSTRSALSKHSEDMGKATKAISGDMLQIKESIFELRQGLLTKIEELREFASKLERDTRSVAQSFDITVEKFDERFGRVIQLREEINIAHGKIIQLEEKTGQFHVNIAKSDKRFQQIASALALQKTEIEKLQKRRDEI